MWWERLRIRKALAEAGARASATVPVPVPVRVRRPLLSTELESAQSEERQQYIWSQQCQPREAGMCAGCGPHSSMPNRVQPGSRTKYLFQSVCHALSL